MTEEKNEPSGIDLIVEIVRQEYKMPEEFTENIMHALFTALVWSLTTGQAHTVEITPLTTQDGMFEGFQVTGGADLDGAKCKTADAWLSCMNAILNRKAYNLHKEETEKVLPAFLQKYGGEGIKIVEHDLSKQPASSGNTQPDAGQSDDPEQDAPIGKEQSAA